MYASKHTGRTHRVPLSISVRVVTGADVFRHSDVSAASGLETDAHATGAQKDDEVLSRVDVTGSCVNEHAIWLQRSQLDL